MGSLRKMRLVCFGEEIIRGPGDYKGAVRGNHAQVTGKTGVCHDMHLGLITNYNCYGFTTKMSTEV